MEKLPKSKTDPGKAAVAEAPTLESKAQAGLRGMSFADGASAVKPKETKAANNNGALASISGDVRFKPARGTEWTEATPGMRLEGVYQVMTGSGASAVLVFDDGTDLRLGADALLVLYGASSRTAKTPAEEKTQVLLNEGTVKGGIAALDGRR